MKTPIQLPPGWTLTALPPEYRKIIDNPEPRWPTKPVPFCLCNKPLLLYIPPGEVAYPCPVHPTVGVRGTDITW